jgi:hypothetical protein
MKADDKDWPGVTKAKGPSWIMALIAVSAMLLSLNLDQAFTRRSISTVVLNAQLPLTCTSADLIIPLPIRRSSIPEPAQPYCGVLITEHGTFRVIENGMFIPGAMPRAEIVKAFKPGCTATLHYFGWEAAPEPWPGYNPKSRLWVYAVEYPADCITDPFMPTERLQG